MRDIVKQALGAVWGAACGQIHRGFDWLNLVPRDVQERSPRWWTPIGALEIYGVSVLGGDAGAGKSMFAMSTALQSALRDDVATVYVAAEMTREQVYARLGWLAKAWGHTPKTLEFALSTGRLVVLLRNGPTTFAEFTEAVGAGLMGEDSGLVVVDSINSLLDSFEDDLDYWTRFRSLRNAVIDARRQSEGRLAFLLLSELNKDSVTKGRQWEYAADLVLNFKQTAAPRTVAVRVVKSREPGVEGALGEWAMTQSGTYQRVGGYDA
jgi:predicted ATP-dependent serine protease